MMFFRLGRLNGSILGSEIKSFQGLDLLFGGDRIEWPVSIVGIFLTL